MASLNFLPPPSNRIRTHSLPPLRKVSSLVSWLIAALLFLSPHVLYLARHRPPQPLGWVGSAPSGDKGRSLPSSFIKRRKKKVAKEFRGKVQCCLAAGAEKISWSKEGSRVWRRTGEKNGEGRWVHLHKRDTVRFPRTYGIGREACIIWLVCVFGILHCFQENFSVNFFFNVLCAYVLAL